MSRRFVSSLLAVALSAVGLGACSGDDGRSVKKFCSTYSNEKAQFQSTYDPASKSKSDSATVTLLGIVQAFQSLGDAVVIFDKLDAVAPTDIEPDVAAVRDSLKNLESAIGDEAANALNPVGLFGAAARGTLNAFESNGSWTRLANYIEDHCTS